ncbi:MAG: PD-(D/E)XK motif protein [Nitrospiraceae bacterium]|nr:MAG: PD-(D/E)XK motif protein [Nitrospiraceae bacterium]
MNELVLLFNGLQTPSSGSDFPETFSGIQIPSRPSWHLCKDRYGRPALLVSIPTEGSRINTPPSIALENLRVEHNIQCRIAQAKKQGDIIIRHFSILQCLSDERALHEYFLLTMSAIIKSLPEALSVDQLSDTVDVLADLFHTLQQAPKQSVQGLWAELFVIAFAQLPEVMLQAWHDNTDERYDFSLGAQRVEVKSSGDRTRRHHFALEQAYPPTGTDVLVASILVEQAANGMALGELWDKVREIAGADSDLLLKVESICINALGASWSTARSKRYDRYLAEQSLLCFDIRSMPRVSEDQPHGITDVRFRADLSFSRPIDKYSYRGLGPLFNACLTG